MPILKQNDDTDRTLNAVPAELSIDKSETLSIENDFTGKSNLKIKFHYSIDNLEPEWLDLEQRGHCSPFQRHSWARALYLRCQKYGATGPFNNCKPFIVTGQLQDKLVFILPLVLEKNLLGKHLKWIDGSVSDYNGMIIDLDFAEKVGSGFYGYLIARIRAEVPDLDSIFLTRNSESHDALNWMNVDADFRWESEYQSHTLQLSNCWKSVFKKTRSKKSRDRLRSKLRSLNSVGKVTFKQIRDQHEKLEHTNLILDWKTDQLKQKGSRNPFGNKSLPTSTRKAIFSSIESNDPSSLKVFGLFLDGQLIAGMLAFVTNHNFYYLVSAYSPDVPSKFSIGTQLLIKTLELASRSGLKEYDFLLGDEAYKFDWCDRSLPMTDYLMPLTLKGKAYRVFVKSSQKTKTLVKNTSFLSQAFKWLMRLDLARIPREIAISSSGIPMPPEGASKTEPHEKWHEASTGKIVTREGY